jgi:hypothetical protein
VLQAHLDDLKASGLTPDDMRVRDVTPSELAVCNVPGGTSGYVIPYFNYKGEALPFYRLKLIKWVLKYKQPKDTQNHVYYPPNFLKVLSAAAKEGKRYIIIVEGEKKAACLCKNGIAAVGLGGVDSWRNRTIVLPADTKLEKDGKDGKAIKAKLPSTKAKVIENITVAEGFGELVDLAHRNKLKFIICFDSDLKGKVKPEVQRAAAMLGFELRYRGMQTANVKQLVLPEIGSGKTGVDDFIVAKGMPAFQKLVDTCLRTDRGFPRHPSPKAFINQRLELGSQSRKEAQETALSILVELDAGGRRLRNEHTNQPYYFNEATFKLMPVSLGSSSNDPLHETAFGQHLYEHFGVGSADAAMMKWLATQFTGEQPVHEITPRRVVCLTPEDHTNPDGLAYQLSDSQFVTISPDPKKALELHPNGSRGILFEQNQVIALDSERVIETFNEQRDLNKPFTPWWFEVLEDIDLHGKENNHLAALLNYLSPWLQRWKGLQLPIELWTGEAGSGKSSLQSLRLQILTGLPDLRNSPTDLRDWYASITNAGGLHVIDNLHFVNRELQQRMSDEICRLITAPQPSIEQRKLYTTSDIQRIPVSCVFAMTAITMPFQAADLIQRAAVFNINKKDRPVDSDWVQKQIDKFGDREAWVGHHLAFLHRFMNLASKKWDNDYKARHRLAHFEQALKIADEVCGSVGEETEALVDKSKTQGSEHNLVETLDRMTQETLSGSDEAMEGIKQFIYETSRRDKPNIFTAKEISQWAQADEDYKTNSLLINARKLGKYIQAHKYALERSVGMKEYDRYGNATRYIVPLKAEPVKVSTPVSSAKVEANNAPKK